MDGRTPPPSLEKLPRKAERSGLRKHALRSHYSSSSPDDRAMDGHLIVSAVVLSTVVLSVFLLPRLDNQSFLLLQMSSRSSALAGQVEDIMAAHVRLAQTLALFTTINNSRSSANMADVVNQTAASLVSSTRMVGYTGANVVNSSRAALEATAQRSVSAVVGESLQTSPFKSSYTPIEMVTPLNNITSRALLYDVSSTPIGNETLQFVAQAQRPDLICKPGFPSALLWADSSELPDHRSYVTIVAPALEFSSTTGVKGFVIQDVIMEEVVSSAIASSEVNPSETKPFATGMYVTIKDLSCDQEVFVTSGLSSADLVDTLVFDSVLTVADHSWGVAIRADDQFVLQNAEQIYDWVSLSSVTAAVTLTLCLLSVMSLMTLMAVVWIFKNREYIRAASYGVILQMCCAAIIMLAVPLLHVGEPTNLSCHGRLWLFNVGFTMYLGSFVIKTYKVVQIFFPARLATVKLHTQSLFAVILLGQIAVLVWLSLTFEQMSGRHILPMQGSVLHGCSLRSHWALFTFRALIVVYAFLLALRSSHINDKRFNESQPFAFCLYNICVVLFIVEPLVLASGAEPSLGLLTAEILIITLLPIGVLMLPKVHHTVVNSMKRRGATIVTPKRGLHAGPMSSTSDMRRKTAPPRYNTNSDVEDVTDLPGYQSVSAVTSPGPRSHPSQPLFRARGGAPVHQRPSQASSDPRAMYHALRTARELKRRIGNDARRSGPARIQNNQSGRGGIHELPADGYDSSSSVGHPNGPVVESGSLAPTPSSVLREHPWRMNAHTNTTASDRATPPPGVETMTGMPHVNATDPLMSLPIHEHDGHSKGEEPVRSLGDGAIDTADDVAGPSRADAKVAEWQSSFGNTSVTQTAQRARTELGRQDSDLSVGSVSSVATESSVDPTDRRRSTQTLVSLSSSTEDLHASHAGTQRAPPRRRSFIRHGKRFGMPQGNSTIQLQPVTAKADHDDEIFGSGEELYFGHPPTPSDIDEEDLTPRSETRTLGVRAVSVSASGRVLRRLRNPNSLGEVPKRGSLVVPADRSLVVPTPPPS